MTKSELTKRYFDWMYELVFWTDKSYIKLLTRLHDTPFRYSIEMDGNREADGINLRYRFGFETGCEDYIIASYLDDRPCSVLEMMVALSIRCEEHIMTDPEIGDRTAVWFRGMIENLGLLDMTDDRFDVERVDDTICRFLNRAYLKNGKYGLFTVKNRYHDMRSIEIWYQLCLYLDELISKEGTK